MRALEPPSKMTSNGSRSGEKKEKRSFWGVRVREREKEMEREREVDGASKLTKMIGEWKLYIESVSASLNPHSSRLLSGHCCE